MNWLLILVVLLVAGNIVWGFFRGFLRVVYSMAKRNCKMPWQGKKKVQKNKTRRNRKISAVWE